VRRVPALLAVPVAVVALAGCGASAQHVEDICGDVTSGTAELARYDPDRPATAVAFALGRFEEVEAAVSKAREASLPSDTAAVLRTDWLEPAVASMADWESRLAAVRTAAAGDDRAALDAALASALALGTEGVDTGALERAGYGACATAFTAPSVAAARS
jgi:outer membrane murein-binding lipoprotein Lpp